jgi:hypothetical protein
MYDFSFYQACMGQTQLVPNNNNDDELLETRWEHKKRKIIIIKKSIIIGPQLAHTRRAWHRRKILNRPKEMNAVSTKVLLRFFPSVCPFAPSIFSQVTHRHVLHF